MNAQTSGPLASRRCRKLFDEAMRQVARLSQLASEPDGRLFQRAERVSAWSVADHLGHLAKSNRAMAGAIRKIVTPGSGEAAGSLTLVGRAVLFTGWIPRGVGKAPEYTRPQVESGEQLRREMDGSQRLVSGLGDVLPEIETSTGRVAHFAFGGLTAAQWLRVMAIHMRHHLKIIAAIRKSQNESSWG